MGLSLLKFSLMYCTCASHSAVLLSSFMRTVERTNTSVCTFTSSLKGFQLRRTSNYIFFNVPKGSFFTIQRPMPSHRTIMLWYCICTLRSFRSFLDCLITMLNIGVNNISPSLSTLGYPIRLEITSRLANCAPGK